MTLAIDALESVTGSAAALMVATAANYYVLPFWGFVPDVGQSIQMGLFFFALSIANRFIFRRVFRRLFRRAA